LAQKYDLVSLLIGVNNQYQALPLADFEKDFRNLLDSAVKYAGGQKNGVFVLSIPNYGFTPFGADKKEQITQELAVFNALSKSICIEKGIDYFDVTTISLQAENDASYRANDNLHPSAAQYTDWVLSFLDKVLGKV
jgi:lysophospholipase L1-like esterase